MKRSSVYLACLLSATVLLLSAATASASQVVTVTPTPGNPTQSGNDLLTALAGITDASWGKRYVLKIEPGVYNLGNQNLVMKEFVDVAGCGTESTFIYGNGNTAIDGIDRGLIEGANNAELRDLTVRVYPAEGREYLVPIYLQGLQDLHTRITNVYTKAFGAEEYCGGIFGRGYGGVIENVQVRSTCPGEAVGIALQGVSLSGRRPSIIHADVSVVGGSAEEVIALLVGTATPPLEIRDSSFLASGGGTVIGYDHFPVDGTPTGSTTIIDSSFVATGGSVGYGLYLESFDEAPDLFFKNSTLRAAGNSVNRGIGGADCAIGITIENGLVEGSTSTVENNCNPVTGTIQIGASRMAGGPVTGFGTTTCAGVYDESFTFSASTCP